VRVNGEMRERIQSYNTLVLSPNKQYVAYNSDDNGYALRVYNIVRDETVYGVPLITPEDPDGVYDVGVYRWSSQDMLAFTTANAYTSAWLYIYDPWMDAYKAVEVDSFEGCGSICDTQAPIWSPNGEYLALMEYGYNIAQDTKIEFYISIFDTQGNTVTRHIVDNLAGSHITLDAWTSNTSIGYYLNGSYYDTIVVE